MTAEVKLVYGLNSPEEFEDAKAKLEATDAEDLLKRIVEVLPDTKFSYRCRQGQGWPQYEITGPKTKEKPGLISRVITQRS